MSFLQKEPLNCIHSFRIQLSDLIRALQTLNFTEKEQQWINPISKEIHLKYEKDLFDSQLPTIVAMMKKWKECDSDDCRSNLLVLDDDSLGCTTSS